TYTDYVLRLEVNLLYGKAAAKVTSGDRLIALASSSIDQPNEKSKRKADKNADDEDDDEIDSTAKESSDSDAETVRRTAVLLMPFASGNRSEVRLVLSNN